MATNIAPLLKQRYDDSNGNPLAGGKIYTYQSGTTTLQATYTDSTGVTPNSNPVILDASGQASIWLDVSLSYKFVVKDSSDNLQFTTDGVIGLTTNNSVATASIQDGAVTTPKLADGAVTGPKLASDVSVDANRPVSTNNIKDATITLAKLASDVSSIISSLAPVGALMTYMGTTAPSSWLISNGSTIGNASSGGTSRANADTLNLFTLLWNSISNTDLPIQDSSGSASVRGASATADFNANKRLPLPDLRNVFLRGVNASTRTIGGNTYPVVTLGATVVDTFKSHSHTLIRGTGAGSSGSLGNAVNAASSDTPTYTFNTAIQATGDSETVPVNIGVNYIIKY
jgi:hypothetical protein